MASYKARVKELEEAVRILEDELDGGQVSTDKLKKLCRHVLSGGTVQGANITVTKKNFMYGGDIEVALGTPASCDPSTETYWNM